MRQRVLIGLFLLLTCWSCTNIEDATPAERKTFIRFYEAAHNLSGVSAEPLGDGYIILGNELLANGNQNSVIIRTDANGERTAEDIILEGGAAKSLKIADDGYYIVGDSIKLNLESADVPVFDLLIYSARIFKLDLNGNVVSKLVIADRKDTINFTDIHGGAVTLNAQNEVIVLGTFKAAGPNTTERPFLTALNPTTLDTVWSRTYDVLDRDYVNSRSVHVTNSGKIIWATALLVENQNFSRSYLGIPYIQENSTFENFSKFGEQTDQQLYPNEIAPASTFGYGIVGTYATPSGTEGNVFFIRVDDQGSIIPGSERYFDGELTRDNSAVQMNESASDDTGDALTATSDGGFVLAGSMTTTPNRGEGGKDVFLIKVDGLGNVMWNKIIGGAGNETVTSVRETADGGLLICGSNNLSGLSSIFIMKTDKNGQLKD